MLSGKRLSAAAGLCALFDLAASGLALAQYGLGTGDTAWMLI